MPIGIAELLLDFQDPSEIVVGDMAPEIGAAEADAPALEEEDKDSEAA